MYELTVNGRPVTAARDETLLCFLREELGLTSVKNGCAQGACGACMILVNGIPTRACVLSTARAVGKTILTCEGLSPRERDVYAYAFSRTGAVQCGFCTPGMVISAKGLLDRDSAPDRADVRAALRGNLCRCTGYQKIVDAVLLAAQLLREKLPVPAMRENGALGTSMLRVDAPAKVLGEAEYVDDLRFEGLLFGSALRSDYPRAIVRSIDCAAARALPGVVCVLTAAELPGAQKIGHLKKDYDVLIPVGCETHFCGDAIALIAAESREALAQAKALIRVDYEPLPPVLTLEDAMREDAPQLHPHAPGNLLSVEHLQRGDADAKIKASPHVVTTSYVTPPTEHAFLEPESAVALPEGDGVLIYCADQGIYQTRRECAEALGLAPEQVRVVAGMVGG
ncbi:MAG: 2Fe-2S iron-sulfur cluster-binding protein, partial [Oscillospiraceae bacterium]